MPDTPRKGPEHRKLERVAYHEAGHAVAALELRRAFRYVSVIPGEDNLGHVLMRPVPGSVREGMSWSDPKAHRWLELECLILLSGPAAEAEFVGRYNHVGAGSDYRECVDVALRLMDDEIIGKFMAYMAARARCYIRNPNRWVQVEALAAALVTHRKLSRKRVDEVCREGLRNRERFNELLRHTQERDEARQAKLNAEYERQVARERQGGDHG
jgi:hypothetical protein